MAERSAATATDRTSLASFLLVFPASSSRTRAVSFGRTGLGTLTTDGTFTTGGGRADGARRQAG